VKTGEIINKLKADPGFADTLLYPGKQLGDIDVTKLSTGTLPSGFASLDNMKVLKRDAGELVIIGARPGQGKSGLGFQIATNIAQWGRAYVASLEMSHEAVAARQMSIIMNWPLDVIQGGKRSSEDLLRAKEALLQVNCIIDDRPGLNVYQICDAARMQNKKQHLDVVVIDYIQIVATDGSDYSRAVAVGKISGELKALAKELRIPVIALSQLNRGSEVRDLKTGATKQAVPDMSQLKESGSLEQDADVVLLIHRTKDSPGTAKVIVAKNRNGPTGEITMQFAPAQCRFIDMVGSELD
jgi:replicative DNA helicase